MKMINFTLVGQDTTAHAADPGAEGVGIDGSIIPPPAPPTVGRGRVIPDIDPALRQESCPICKRTPRVSECLRPDTFAFRACWNLLGPTKPGAKFPSVLSLVFLVARRILS